MWAVMGVSENEEAESGVMIEPGSGARCEKLERVLAGMYLRSFLLITA